MNRRFITLIWPFILVGCTTWQAIENTLPDAHGQPQTQSQSAAIRTVAIASTSTIYSYNNPPPLPASNPATTVTVTNVSQLINAINSLQSGQTISIAAGTY